MTKATWAYLADTLNRLSPGANASARRMGVGELLAAIHNAVSTGPRLSHLTTTRADLLAGIRNMLGASPEVSNLTARNAHILAEAVGLLDADDAGGGGSPPAGYTTGAVAFDGVVELGTESLIAPNDTAVGSFSFWYLSNSANNGFYPLYSDPVNTGASFAQVTSTSQISLSNPPDGTGVDVLFNRGADEQWHHLLASLDGSGSGAGKIYIDGVDATGTVHSFGDGLFQIGDLPFYVGGWDGQTLLNPGDLADVWVAVGQSLLVAGDIPPATVAKFISGGKPVDLGADGSTPTGLQPTIFLRAVPGSEVATFPTNHGTGGAFAATGGSLTVAPSSPSD